MPCRRCQADHWPSHEPASASLPLALHVGLAIGIDIDVQCHGMATDRAVFNVVLVRSGRNIHRHHNLLATGVADIGGLEAGSGPAPTPLGGFLGHWENGSGVAPLRLKGDETSPAATGQSRPRIFAKSLRISM